MSPRKQQPDAAHRTPTPIAEAGPDAFDPTSSKAKTPAKTEKAPAALAPVLPGRRDGWAEHRMKDVQRAASGAPPVRGHARRPGPLTASSFNPHWHECPAAPRAEEFARDLNGRHTEERN